MKKVILILSVFMLTACKKETPTPVEPTCSCYVIEEYKLYEDMDVWLHRPNTPFRGSDETDCDKNNEIIQEWTMQGWFGLESFRKRLVCD